MTIGETIKKHRKEAGMTQEELAKLLAVSTPAVNKWENGNAFPDITMIAPLARLFGITTDELLVYNETIPLEEFNKFVGHLSVLALNRKVSLSEEYFLVEKKIAEYPNDYGFILLICHIMERFVKSSTVEENEEARILKSIEGYYKRCLESSDEYYRTEAAERLFYHALDRARYQEAEEYLEYFSDYNPKKDLLRAKVWRSSGQSEKAFQLYEDKLFHKALDLFKIMDILAEMYAEGEDSIHSERIQAVRDEISDAMMLKEYYTHFVRRIEHDGLQKDIDDEESLDESLNEIAKNLNRYHESPLFRHYNNDFDEEIVDVLKKTKEVLPEEEIIKRAKESLDPSEEARLLRLVQKQKRNIIESHVADS